MKSAIAFLFLAVLAAPGSYAAERCFELSNYQRGSTWHDLGLRQFPTELCAMGYLRRGNLEGSFVLKRDGDILAELIVERVYLSQREGHYDSSYRVVAIPDAPNQFDREELEARPMVISFSSDLADDGSESGQVDIGTDSADFVRILRR